VLVDFNSTSPTTSPTPKGATTLQNSIEPASNLPPPVLFIVKMVLQDMSDPTPDFTADSTPSSDTDAYDSSSSNASNPSLPFPFDPSQYPRPLLPPVFHTYAQREAAARRLALSAIQHATEILGRPPTPTERDALLHHNLKAIAIASYGTYVGTAAGLLRYAFTFRKYPLTGKLPLVKGNITSEFSPYVFPVPSMPLLRGQGARLAHVLMRGSLYLNIGAACGMLLMSSYGLSVSSVGIATDTRLKEYSAMMVRRAKEERAELKRQVQERSLEGVKRTPTQRGGRRPMDDASPTAGGVDEGVYAGDAASMRWEGAAGAGSDTGVMDDGQMAKSSGSSPSTPTRSWQPRERAQDQARTTPYQQPQESTSGDITDDFISPSTAPYDDASPTARPSQSPSEPSGSSTWDRLRREAASTPSTNRRGIGGPRPQRPAPDRSAQQPGQDGESFSFSSREEEKQLAKEQAQKEFDRMVERERRGDEGAGGSTGGRGGWQR
jgi:hypothetical protein